MYKTRKSERGLDNMPTQAWGCAAVLATNLLPRLALSLSLLYVSRLSVVRLALEHVSPSLSTSAPSVSAASPNERRGRGRMARRTQLRTLRNSSG